MVGSRLAVPLQGISRSLNGNAKLMFQLTFFQPPRLSFGLKHARMTQADMMT